MILKTTKILPVELFQYCESTGKPINSYDLVGVHYMGAFNTMEVGEKHFLDYDDEPTKSPLEMLAKEAPKGTEAVVNYRYTLDLDTDNGIWIYSATGLALVPKDNSKTIKDNNLISSSDDQDRKK